MRDGKSRFIVGIDLGTTNCAVSYIDTWDKNRSSQIFRIPQFNGQKMVEALSLLPSFYYLAETNELENCKLPWEAEPRNYAVGLFAQKEGLKTPTKLVSSAKSWLSNKTCERKEKILPLEVFDSSRKISPVEASSAFLDHIRQAWNAHFAKSDAANELEQQELIITVPASFDEVARSLTIEAAKKAQLSHFTLLEEPQAAFYSWLMDHETSYAHYFQSGDTIVVCDVGGGTCDFSLIQVTEVEKELEFQRMAVGPHLLLGGDNMDLAICHYMEAKRALELTPEQWLSLRFMAKEAKEFLLNAREPTNYSLWIGGKGSKVVGGGFGLQLNSEEIKQLLADGFFGLYDYETARSLKKATAIRSMGLNFETEPSITKQLANFLHQSHVEKKPKYILLNGGALKPKIFQERLIQSIDQWYEAGSKPKILESYSLDLAVARGAAYFGYARGYQGVRIGGGTPRTYYLKMQGDLPRALTLVERGTKEGTEVFSSSLFSITANTPVSFQLLHSHTRLGDKKDSLISIEDEEMAYLPPLVTVLKFGQEKQISLPVRLRIKMTELGILELSLMAVQTDHVWKLEFQLRNADKSDAQLEKRADETIEEPLLQKGKQEIQEAFAVGQQEKLKGIMASLESVLQKPKQEWSPSVLRSLFDPLMAVREKRDLAAAYESRFWNLAGFFLRPGAGYPLDDYRIKELWKLILADLKKPKSPDVEIQKWIFYRRISHGLKKGQQAQLFNELFSLLYHAKKKSFIVDEKKGRYAFEEKLRALSSLELVDVSLKLKLGNALLDRILSGVGHAAEYWSLGRLGARNLLYGGIQHVIPKEVCEEWIEKLLKNPAAHNEHLPFLLYMLSRKTDFREVNLSQKYLEFVESYLKDKEETFADPTSHQVQERIFGDSLPQGLTLISQGNLF